MTDNYVNHFLFYFLPINHVLAGRTNMMLAGRNVDKSPQDGNSVGVASAWVGLQNDQCWRSLGVVTYPSFCAFILSASEIKRGIYLVLYNFELCFETENTIWISLVLYQTPGQSYIFKCGCAPPLLSQCHRASSFAVKRDLSGPRSPLQTCHSLEPWIAIDPSAYWDLLISWKRERICRTLWEQTCILHLILCI